MWRGLLDLAKPVLGIVAAAGILGQGPAGQALGPESAQKTKNPTEPYPGFSQGGPPPFVNPLSGGVAGGLMGGTQFSESFFIVLLIVAFIVLVRYLH
jgi:hypothetical protein